MNPNSKKCFARFLLISSENYVITALDYCKVDRSPADVIMVKYISFKSFSLSISPRLELTISYEVVSMISQSFVSAQVGAVLHSRLIDINCKILRNYLE